MKQIYCLFFSLLLASSIVFASSKTDSLLTERIVSLKASLAESKAPAERLKVLYDLSRCYRDTPEERNYDLRLYREALALDSLAQQESAAFALVGYYYNQNITDSVVYWNDQMKRIAEQRHSYTNGYFIAGNLTCRYLLWHDITEEGANEALRLYNLARKEGSEVGIYSSCETMGIAYTVMGRDSLAITYFEEGLHRVRNFEPVNKTVVLSILESMFEAEVRSQNTENMGEQLSLYESTTEEIAASKQGKEAFSADRCRWLAHTFRIEYYTLRGDFDQVQQHIEKGNLLAPHSSDLYVRYRFHLAQARYYKAVGNYDAAMSEMDEVFKLGNTTELFLLKGEILLQKGNYKEAAECYKLALKTAKKKENASFMRQMTQLSHLHDISRETQAHNEEVLKRKQWQLIVLFVSICFIGILLFVVFSYTLRVRHMNHSIRKERDLLVESENNLRILKDKAEQSDQLKSLFLANMSHEIRTPLNAIVGFSQLLCDTDEVELSKEERGEYSNLIVHNSELLLNLINDILDISKLEANSYHFSFEEHDINESCHTCLESVRHRVAPGVQLSFTPPQEHFLLKTDKLRLEQVLMNLLSNAAKFTKQGEINLTYQVEEAEKQVRFSVTDTGCGIPDGKQKVIFNRFEKLNDYVQGTGLGLAISSLIVKQFGGTIFVDETYRQGARFVFTHRL